MKKMKTYMEDRPTTNMKKGWICINSYDEKKWEIAPVDRDSGSSDDPALMMIQWWSSFDDDPVMMIRWWSNFDDDLVII